MFRKNFKVRVAYFAECRYTVEWACYRFIPIWHTINIWYDFGFTSGLEGFSPKLFYIQDAEIFALRLNSIDDIDRYYKHQRELKSLFLANKREYYRNNAPYKSKIIK